jgi:hypothetical protein
MPTDAILVTITSCSHRIKGVSMKIMYSISFVALLIMCTVFSVSSFAQSAQCTVQQIQGSLVTMTCPGVGTRVENIGGAADRYKVGDAIAGPTPSQSRDANDQRSTVDPRSGRR